MSDNLERKPFNGLIVPNNYSRAGVASRYVLRKLTSNLSVVCRKNKPIPQVGVTYDQSGYRTMEKLTYT